MVIQIVILAESSRILQFSRTWQKKFNGLAEFSKILWSGRIWQNLAKFYSLAEYGKMQQKQQIAVDYGKLQSYGSSGSDPSRTQQDLVDQAEYSKSGKLP